MCLSCAIKNDVMDDHIFLIVLGIPFCSLAIVTFVFLHCRKVEQKCKRYIAKGIHEQDCLARQLERTRIEKETMEKVIKTELSEAVKTSIDEKKSDDGAVAPKEHASRIEITYYI